FVKDARGKRGRLTPPRRNSYHHCDLRILDKGKPVVRRRRKAMGPTGAEPAPGRQAAEGMDGLRALSAHSVLRFISWPECPGREALLPPEGGGRYGPRVCMTRVAAKGVCLMHRFVKAVKRFLQKEDGPTAVEYAVMLALIVVVCISAITALGGNANKVFNNVA